MVTTTKMIVIRNRNTDGTSNGRKGQGREYNSTKPPVVIIDKLLFNHICFSNVTLVTYRNRVLTV